MTRIEQTFKKLKADKKKAFVSYIMAGDPDFKTSLELVMGLPDAGVDIIELGPGDGSKSKIIIDGFLSNNYEVTYYPIDISIQACIDMSIG